MKIILFCFFLWVLCGFLRKPTLWSICPCGLFWIQRDLFGRQVGQECLDCKNGTAHLFYEKLGKIAEENGIDKKI